MLLWTCLRLTLGCLISPVIWESYAANNISWFGARLWCLRNMRLCLTCIQIHNRDFRGWYCRQTAVIMHSSITSCRLSLESPVATFHLSRATHPLASLSSLNGIWVSTFYELHLLYCPKPHWTSPLPASIFSYTLRRFPLGGPVFSKFLPQSSHNPRTRRHLMKQGCLTSVSLRTLKSQYVEFHFFFFWIRRSMLLDFLICWLRKNKCLTHEPTHLLRFLNTYIVTSNIQAGWRITPSRRIPPTI